MYQYTYSSPIGDLVLIEENRYLIEIAFIDQKKGTIKKTPFLTMVIKQLDEYFQGVRKEFDIPYKLQGTPFQLKVWDALTKIPYGKTVSYKDVAMDIDHPKASRAIGNANNKNPIPIIVPCHRVIGSNHKLVGYASGLDKKEYLLKLEKAD